MLNKLVAFSLKNRLFIVIVAVMVALYGAFAASKMAIDVLPDLNRPTVTIMTEAHSMVPSEVERLITQPLERSLNGATGVVNVRSASGMGLSVITVGFDWGTDVYLNRQIIQERLQAAKKRLGLDVEPKMAPISSIMGQVQIIGIQSKSGKTSTTDLRALVDYEIKYRLLSVQGVANIVSSGGAPRQLQVIVDADKLRSFEVTLEEVAEAVEKSNVLAAGGFLKMGSKGPVITVTGYVQKEMDVAMAVVKTDPLRPVLVSDVAEVNFGPAAIKIGEAGVNGRPGVVMVVFKQLDTDTVKLTNDINAELASIQEGLPDDIVLVNDIFQQATFIERAIQNVEDAVLHGGLLVVLILFVFLLNFRTTFITLTAIPLSIGLTIIIFSAFGLSINTMTLGGIAVAIGALVDDAIVGLENIFRRLKQNAKSEKPQNTLWIIFKAVSEVRKAIVIGTLLVIVVYLPLFLQSGL
jgi:Cu/Ag efflux pump CusA